MAIQIWLKMDYKNNRNTGYINMGGNGLFKNKRKIDYKKIKMIIMNLWRTYDYFKIQYWKD